MPTYEYRCNSCGKTFTQQTSVSEHDSGKPTCPKCQGAGVSQTYSAVYVKTSKKS
jgi:putative FmdB family regulatory protein